MLQVEKIFLYEGFKSGYNPENWDKKKILRTTVIILIDKVIVLFRIAF